MVSSHRRFTLLLGAILAGSATSVLLLQAEEQSRAASASLAPVAKERTAGEGLAPTLAEFRTRAALLHELIHGALQVMHRDFFDEDESRVIPSRSLEDVFKELEQTHHVQARWLVVNAAPMSIDNNPRDDFERTAAQELSKGKAFFEDVEGDRYRYVGAIRLSNRCLKCHLPARSTNEDRTAGIALSFSLRPAAPEKGDEP